ncbi:hypothetical protein, partial [Mycoplasma sp. CSL7503-lung]
NLENHINQKEYYETILEYFECLNVLDLSVDFENYNIIRILNDFIFTTDIEKLKKVINFIKELISVEDWNEIVLKIKNNEFLENNDIYNYHEYIETLNENSMGYFFDEMPNLDILIFNRKEFLYDDSKSNFIKINGYSTKFKQLEKNELFYELSKAEILEYIDEI